MAEIFRQYGQTVLVVVSALLLISLLFVTWPSEEGSVVTDIGDRAATTLDARQTGQSNPVFDEYATRQPPTVSVAGVATAGESVDLIGMITITDSYGAVWDTAAASFVAAGGAHSAGSVRVTSIRAESPDIEDPMFDGASGYVTFEKAGLYTVTLRILDRYSVAGSFAVPLVVDFVDENMEDNP